MPDGLPDAAYSLIDGRFTEEQRKGIFKPEIPVGSTHPRRRGFSPTRGAFPSA